MFLVFEDRASDSPFVERVWRSHSERAGTFQSIAACHWEMVVSRHDGKTFLTVRGPETKVTQADCPAQGEWIGIRFKLGTYMPMLPPGELRDRKDRTLPDDCRRAFWLNGSAWEYPSYENAEVFVRRLLKSGLMLTDQTVADALCDQPRKLCTRSVQRRFLQTTGMSHTTIRQIERARYATNLLKRGTSILDTVDQAGYYDQPHLTRSLKRWVGETPEQILRAESQLSLLYNTTPA